MVGRWILKKNIVIVSLNDFIMKEVCLLLAKKLNMNFVDIDTLIEKELLANKGESLNIANDYLSSLERRIIQKVVGQTNSVLSISAETYLANNHIDYFHETNLIYLQTTVHSIDVNLIKNKAERTRIEQNTTLHENLNEFLMNSSNSVVENADVKDIKEIVKEIEQLINV